MELDGDGVAAVFPPMQERGASRSRAGGRLVLVEAVAQTLWGTAARGRGWRPVAVMLRVPTVVAPEGPVQTSAAASWWR